MKQFLPNRELFATGVPQPPIQLDIGFYNPAIVG